MLPIFTNSYLPFLEGVLTPARLRHSIGVMQVMEQLSGVYAFDRELGAATGLLHDAAKDLPEEQWKEIVAREKIALHEPADADYNLYLHGPVGAALVKEVLGITDPVMLECIQRHTFYGSGDRPDTPFEWCLRFSDLLEPNRRWDNAPQLSGIMERHRELAFGGRWQAAAQLQASALVEMFEARGYPVHSEMRKRGEQRIRD